MGGDGEQGVECLPTPQKLVDGLGIGKGSLYHAFDSKRGLYDLALTEYVRRRSDFLASTLSRPGSRLEALAEVVDTLVGIDDPNCGGCFIVNAVAELGTDDAIVSQAASRLFGLIKKEFGACLRAAIVEGEVKPDLDVEQAAAQLLATVMGATILVRTGTKKRVVRNLLQGAIRDLQPTAQRSTP